MVVQAFRLEVDDERVEDLRARLRDVRLPQVFAPGPSEPQVLDESRERFVRESEEWYYGMSRPRLEELLKEFEGDFLPRWQQVQKSLNELPQYTMELSTGHVMQFIHQKALSRTRTQGITRQDPVPIVLLHGWPSTLYDFRDVIPQLAAQGFHVVVPSLPGFAYSSGEANLQDTAQLVVELMNELGYKHFVAQGGDWGGPVVQYLGANHPECVALHLNGVAAPSSKEVTLVNANKLLRTLGSVMLPSFTLNSREGTAAKRLVSYLGHGSAYFLQNIQSPDTVGLALSNSPAGLLAFLAEKWFFHTWEFNSSVKEHLFTTVAVYWFSQCVSSAARYYRNAALSGDMQAYPSYIDKPTGVLCPVGEILQQPRALLELSFDVRQFTDLSYGGHFLPAEEPRTLADDIVRFVDEAIDFDECIVKSMNPPKRSIWATNPPLRKQLPYAAPFLPFIVGGALLLRSKL